MWLLEEWVPRGTRARFRWLCECEDWVCFLWIFYLWLGEEI